MSQFRVVYQPGSQSPAINQRREERRTVNNSAAVFTTRGQTVGAATIVDRSEHGAKLQLTGDPYLPKEIIVVDISASAIFECEVRWRQNCYVGVQIIDAYGPSRRRQFFETHASALALLTRR